MRYFTYIYILKLDQERLIFGKGKYTTWNLTVQQNKELESFLSIFFLQNKYWFVYMICPCFLVFSYSILYYFYQFLWLKNQYLNQKSKSWQVIWKWYHMVLIPSWDRNKTKEQTDKNLNGQYLMKSIYVPYLLCSIVSFILKSCLYFLVTNLDLHHIYL